MNQQDADRIAGELRMIEEACQGLIRRSSKQDKHFEAYKVAVVQIPLPCGKHYAYRMELSFADSDHAATLGMIDTLKEVLQGKEPHAFSVLPEGKC